MNDSAMRNACAMPPVGLFAVINSSPPNREAVAEQLRKRGKSCGVEMRQSSADAALNERRERVIYHRLVIDRLELFLATSDERNNRDPAPPARMIPFIWKH